MNFAERIAYDAMAAALCEIGAHDDEGIEEALPLIMGALTLGNAHERRGAARAIAERLLGDADRLGYFALAMPEAVLPALAAAKALHEARLRDAGCGLRGGGAR